MKIIFHILFMLCFALSVQGQKKEPIIPNPDKPIPLCYAGQDVALAQLPQGSFNEQSSEFFSSLLDTSSWPARWQCGIWSDFHGWLYIISDVIIGTAYFMIPLILLYFLRKRKQQKTFQFIVVLFVSFILACGSTHFMDAAIFWWPAYRLSALLRLITALVSLGTLFALVKVSPQLMQLKSPVELEALIALRTSALSQLNERLQEEIKQRKSAEEEILKLNMQLEERVAKRTAELQESNRELEGFTYSISHDLRAPLRVIDGFGRILLDDHLSKLDSEGQRLLHSMSKNAKRMGILIDDLLSFSRAGKAEIRLSMVNMNLLIADVLKEMEAGGDVTVPNGLKVEELPATRGDVSLLKQVWINLISNAIKYSGKKAEPSIEIAVQKEGNQYVYVIRDNGAGFDMGQYHKLFGVFQRLHNEREFTGIGVGLALSKRIIEKHGGKIWAEAKPDEGASFFFTIPDRKTGS